MAMNAPTTTQGSTNGTPIRRQIALMRNPAPSQLDLDNDYNKALRRILEQALFAAQNAERRVAEQNAEIDRLRTLSITDENTGLLNRRGFTEALERAIARGQRDDEPSVLLLIDLDGFKSTNDTYGHSAGDFVLSVVADTLKSSTRKVDDVARLGGDEFAVILNKVPILSADDQARSITAHLNTLAVPWNDSTIPVRASVGKYCFGTGKEKCAQEIYDGADRNMYLGKRRKRPMLLESPQASTQKPDTL
jgi:diguanylate cyclase (GGDEF)-like protein